MKLKGVQIPDLGPGRRDCTSPVTAVSYVRSVGQPVFCSSGELVQFVSVSMDVTESRQAEEAFRLIAVGTAETTGRDFFQSLVQHMAQALLVRYVFVSPCDERKHARRLAFWKCLIADIRMSGTSGLELQAKLNEADQRIPIIFITAHGDEKLRLQALRAGTVEFLTLET